MTLTELLVQYPQLRVAVVTATEFCAELDGSVTATLELAMTELPARIITLKRKVAR